MWTISQASKKLKVSRQTIYKLCNCNKLQHVKDGNKFLVVPLDEKVYTVKFMSEELQVSTRRVLQIIKSKEINCYKIGKQIRIPLNEAAKLLLCYCNKKII